MSAIPFTLSIIFPGFTFGNWIIIFSFFQIVVQIALLRKNCVVSELVIQGILAFAFGYLYSRTKSFSIFVRESVQAACRKAAKFLMRPCASLLY